MKLNIGNNIRTLRRSKDMTQDELAEKLGVTFQTINRWENGGTYPDMELLPVLAGIFDVPSRCGQTGPSFSPSTCKDEGGEPFWWLQ